MEPKQLKEKLSEKVELLQSIIAKEARWIYGICEGSRN